MYGVRPILISLAAMSLCSGAVAASKVTEAAPDPFGVWRNAKNTVHVNITPCGSNACGKVIWATAKAQADVRKGSGKTLVGLQVFHDLTPKDGRWAGKVYAPDMNMTFSGSAERTDATTLRAKGCLIGGFLCKSQVWTKIGDAPS